MKLGDEIACSGCGKAFAPNKWVVRRINIDIGKMRYCSKSCVGKANSKFDIPFKAGTPEYTKIYRKMRDNERHKKQVAEWYQKNKERLKEIRYEIHKKWIEKNPEKKAVYAASGLDYRKKRLKIDPDYKKRVYAATNLWHSKQKYGEYAEAHRALCQLQNQLTEK